MTYFDVEPPSREATELERIADALERIATMLESDVSWPVYLKGGAVGSGDNGAIIKGGNVVGISLHGEDVRQRGDRP